MKKKTTATVSTSNVTVEAPAPTIAIPTPPLGATHFLLRRAELELVADLRHLDRDLIAFGGLRPQDGLAFGTVSSSGEFRILGERIGTTAPLAHAAIRRSTSGKMALVDEMIVAGTHTAKDVAEAVVAKFGGDFCKTLVVVRSRPWHLRKAGKLAADAKPFKAAERNSVSAASGIIRAMLLENKHTVDQIVAAVEASTGTRDPKRLKALVRSMPWHLRKSGQVCGYVKVKGGKTIEQLQDGEVANSLKEHTAAETRPSKPNKDASSGATKPTKAKRPAAEKKAAKRVGKRVAKMLAAA